MRKKGKVQVVHDDEQQEKKNKQHNKKSNKETIISMKKGQSNVPWVAL